jgi:hypothetical protein
MLRDLFSFRVEKGIDHHIDARAFSPEKIGKRKYNAAQAALRRACTRLAARGLIATRSGQSRALFWDVYKRSGIGLTESGIAAAEKLLQAENKAASADLGIAIG